MEHSLLLAAGILVPGVVGLRWYWGHVRCRFLTVVAGRFYRSGAMPPARLRRMVRKHRIRAVIDLRSPRRAVDEERVALRELGVAHFQVSSKQTPRDETVEAVLALLDREENRPALIHCNHGVRRAAEFEAICRVEYEGWTNRRALFVLRLRSGFTSFRPGSRGSRFVQSYVPRRMRLRSRGLVGEGPGGNACLVGSVPSA